MLHFLPVLANNFGENANVRAEEGQALQPDEEERVVSYERESRPGIYTMQKTMVRGGGLGLGYGLGLAPSMLGGQSGPT